MTIHQTHYDMPLIADLFAQRFEPLEWTITDGLLWLGGALIAWPTAYYSVMAIYNIYFHPLRNYPGPKSWVATPFWYTMLQLRGSCPRDTTEVHKKYGPVVRISANELSFTYPGAWRDIFGHKGAGKPEFEKDERYFSAYKEPTIINSDRQYHSFLRKKLNNGFSDSALRQQEPLIQDFLNTLMSGLHENSQNGKAALDMTMWYNVSLCSVVRQKLPHYPSLAD